MSRAPPDGRRKPASASRSTVQVDPEVCFWQGSGNISAWTCHGKTAVVWWTDTPRTTELPDVPDWFWSSTDGDEAVYFSRQRVGWCRDGICDSSRPIGKSLGSLEFTEPPPAFHREVVRQGAWVGVDLRELGWLFVDRQGITARTDCAGATCWSAGAAELIFATGTDGTALELPLGRTTALGIGRASVMPGYFMMDATEQTDSVTVQDRDGRVAWEQRDVSHVWPSPDGRFLAFRKRAGLAGEITITGSETPDPIARIPTTCGEGGDVFWREGGVGAVINVCAQSLRWFPRVKARVLPTVLSGVYVSSRDGKYFIGPDCLLDFESGSCSEHGMQIDAVAWRDGTYFANHSNGVATVVRAPSLDPVLTRRSAPSFVNWLSRGSLLYQPADDTLCAVNPASGLDACFRGEGDGSVVAVPCPGSGVRPGHAGLKGR